MASRKLASATIFAIVAMLIYAGSASAAGSVEVLTPSLDFGRAVLGGANSTTKYVELHNATSSTLQLTAMQLSGAISDFIPSFAGATTCPTPAAGPSAGVAPGATCIVTVTYAPTTLGPVSGSLDMTFCQADTTPCTPITTSNVSLGAEGVRAETLSLVPTQMTFASTPIGTSSRTQTVTLTNGSAPMMINGLSLGGAAPHDFVIGRDGCTGSDLSPGASCTFNVHFAPSHAGTRTATVTVLGATIGNSYPTLTLTGVGTGLPTNPGTGPTPTRPNTPTKPGTQPARTGGRYDDVELVTCRTVTIKRGHSPRTVKALRCTATRVRRTVTITADAATTRATISRGAIVYARGWATSRGINRWQLMTHRLRPLRRGSYTLTLRTRHGVRRFSLRVT